MVLLNRLFNVLLLRAFCQSLSHVVLHCPRFRIPNILSLSVCACHVSLSLSLCPCQYSLVNFRGGKLIRNQKRFDFEKSDEKKRRGENKKEKKKKKRKERRKKRKERRKEKKRTNRFLNGIPLMIQIKKRMRNPKIKSVNRPVWKNVCARLRHQGWNDMWLWA